MTTLNGAPGDTLAAKPDHVTGSPPLLQKGLGYHMHANSALETIMKAA